MDGLLIVDKPVGPSSHDVVARARRALGERRIGHTGTLDPGASGVLPLVIGRATRLARFLSSDDKSYEAIVRLGVSTNTYDAAGRPSGAAYEGPLPSRDAIDAALNPYRGPFMQQPPAYSAKKVGGHPSYKLARRADRRQGDGDPIPASDPLATRLSPAAVATSALEIVDINGDCVTLRVDCSAGFYVRALAHDLGDRLGTGAHLLALRRIRSGGAMITDALPLEALEEGDADRGRERASAALIPLSQMLPDLPALVLTHNGAQHAGHGRLLSPADFMTPMNVMNPVNPVNLVNPVNAVPCFRLLEPNGNLLGLARPSQTAGLLHPFVVLM